MVESKAKSSCDMFNDLTGGYGVNSFCPLKADVDHTMEEILVRMDVKDVIRCKSVCKSWYSLISTPYFVKSHLKHAYKRIILDTYGIIKECNLVYHNELIIVGSSNGLVCISPTPKDFKLVVVNPCTKHTIKILQPPPQPLLDDQRNRIRCHSVWGFGYDSYNNEYKIVVGFVTNRLTTRFYVFSLKTRLWKLIEEIDYVHMNWTSSECGVLCDGVLHWFMKNWQNKEQVILSFNLSREEFTETQQPDPALLYKYGWPYSLGIMEESLCIYESDQSEFGLPPRKIWVLRSNNCGTRSWDALPRNYKMNQDVAYLLNKDDYSYDDTPHVSKSGHYIGAPIFVPYHYKLINQRTECHTFIVEAVKDEQQGIGV